MRGFSPLKVSQIYVVVNICNQIRTKIHLIHLLQSLHRVHMTPLSLLSHVLVMQYVQPFHQHQTTLLDMSVVMHDQMRTIDSKARMRESSQHVAFHLVMLMLELHLIHQIRIRYQARQLERISVKSQLSLLQLSLHHPLVHHFQILSLMV